MPVDLKRLKEGWLELESDPGLFTLLLEDFGANGVQVEEIYDLQKPIEGPVYGFIFLFKWIEERRSRRKVVITEESLVENEEIVNSIFFAQQIVPNSCATHALLSVLLNCSTIHLGPTLTRLKEYTKNMSPENKGYAIGNTPELARAHNSHAKSEPRRTEKTHGVSTVGRTKEAFHFVSYVPINGHLFELDGLKPFPIDHGPWSEGEDWTEKFRRVITERLGIATGGEPYHDIRFNLMAVVPDKRVAYEHKLRTLKTNRQIVLEALQQLVKLTHPELTCDDRAACMAAVRKTRLDDSTTLSTPVKQNKTTSNSPYPKLPSALDSHNYAKSPMMEGVPASYRPRYEDYSGSDYSDDESAKLKSERNNRENKAPCSQLPINADVMKPLSIQTKFHSSPTPSASSTDTSSEAGSAFNSPVRTVNFASASPNSAVKNGETLLMEDVRDIKKFLVIRVTAGEEVKKGLPENVKRSISSDSLSSTSEVGVKRTCLDELSSDSNTSGGQEVCRITGASMKSRQAKHPHLIEPHKFAPKDLLALLKTVENEIAVCESNLRDEVEKRKKYKIDDCRRTHCYDQFLCTFLSMLAEQGKLTDLVEQQLIARRRQGIQVGRLHRTTRKPDKRRKSRRKNRNRKK